MPTYIAYLEERKQGQWCTVLHKGNPVTLKSVTRDELAWINTTCQSGYRWRIEK